MTYIMYKTSDKVCDQPRDGTRTAQIGDSLFSFGGWTSDIPVDSNIKTPVPKTYNDIYKTKDLITWEKVGNAEWAGRHTFGLDRLSDKIFVYGSDAQSATGKIDAITNKPDKRPLMDMWLSFDEKNGVQWFNITKESWIKNISNRCLYGSCSDGCYLYMIGGMDTTESFESESHNVWRFDGNIWQPMGNGLGAFEKNLCGACCCFNGKIYVISGGVYGKPGTQDVYSSDDFGVNWRREADIPFKGRQYHNTIVWDNKLWLICGYNAGNLRDIYVMDPDGIWWQFYDVPDDFLPRHASGVAVFNDKLVITNGNYHNDCWVIEKQL